jgi:hypothetical protein
MKCSVLCASNDEGILKATLLASPDLAVGVDVIVERGHVSAAAAYNTALAKAKGDILVLVHQDVYLPSGWFARLHTAVEHLDRSQPRWAVAGVFGITARGEGRGWLYSTGLRRVVGTPFSEPVAVRSLDEVVLILRSDAELRFDESLPGFHLYGTDLCLEAEHRGRTCHAIPCFCIHNSDGKRVLPTAYWTSYGYVRRKWRDRLPVETPCSTISRSSADALTYRLKAAVTGGRRPNEVGQRVEDVEALYRDLSARGLAGA